MDVPGKAMNSVSAIPPDPPTFDLDRYRLRPLRAADRDALFTYLCDPAVTELTSYPLVTLALAEAIIERSNRRWTAGELSKWALASAVDDRLVGTCGFNEHSQTHRHAELAYDLAPAEWGQGLMGRAVRAVLQWVFERDLLNRVQAYVRVDNLRSRRLLARSGFMDEGCLRAYRICRGEPRDFAIYGLLRGEWAGAIETGETRT